MDTLKPMLIRNVSVTEEQLDKLRGMIAQPKLDGVRIVVSSEASFEGTDPIITVRTRSGKSIRPDIQEWIVKKLNPQTDMFYDCELIYDRDCAKSAGILHSLSKSINFDECALFVFDIVDLNQLDEPLSSRIKRPLSIPSWPHVSFFDSLEKARAYTQFKCLPFEGFVLKPARSTYQFGARLEGSYKYKLAAEEEVTVLRVFPQTDSMGNAKPFAGILECGRVNGSIINVTASCDNMLRAAMLARADEIAGAKITIRFMDVPSGKNGNDGALRMPRYLHGLEYLLTGG